MQKDQGDGWVDRGLNFKEDQGLKHKSRGGFGNTFQLAWTVGLF